MQGHTVLSYDFGFSDLEKAESAVLYAPVGSLGQLLVGIEQESFRIE